jgi:hypothetical protein
VILRVEPICRRLESAALQEDANPAIDPMCTGIGSENP